MLVGLLAVALLVAAHVDRLASLAVGGLPLRVVFEAVRPRVRELDVLVADFSALRDGQTLGARSSDAGGVRGMIFERRGVTRFVFRVLYWQIPLLFLGHLLGRFSGFSCLQGSLYIPRC